MSAVPSPEPAPLGLVERLRGVHLAMVDAVLGGDGLERVAQLAADAVGGPVAIVVPRHDVAGAAGGAGAPPPPRPDVGGKVRDRPTRVPDGVAAEAPIASGDEVLGMVVMVGPAPRPEEAREFLHLAAV